MDAYNSTEVFTKQEIDSFLDFNLTIIDKLWIIVATGMIFLM